MRCFIAKAREQVFSGNWQACANWGLDLVKDDPSLVVKLHIARAGEKQARVCSEISCDGIRTIPQGRYLPLRKLKGV